MNRLMIVLIVLLALAACQTPQPAPTATARLPTNTPVPVRPQAPDATSAPTTEPTTEPTTAPAATPIPTQAPSAADVYVESADGLNLRAEANANATLIRTLPFGTHLTAIGQPSAPDAQGIAWQNVRTDDGQSGWVATQFLTSSQPVPAVAEPPPAPATPPAIAMQPGYVYVASVGGLNMRAAASVSSRILTMLANGQRLQTNGLTSGPDSTGITWLNVKTDDGLEGWVSAEFINTQVPSVAPAAPPSNIPDAVAEILRRTNALRAQHGLHPYSFHDGLSQLALAHSQYMAQNGITHIGAGGLSAKQRIANAGFGGRPTENIYGGQATIDQAWEYWSTDPPHLDNLLNAFNTLVGIGVYQTGLLTYYTMDFAAPLP